MPGTEESLRLSTDRLVCRQSRPPLTCIQTDPPFPQTKSPPSLAVSAFRKLLYTNIFIWIKNSSDSFLSFPVDRLFLCWIMNVDCTLTVTFVFIVSLNYILNITDEKYFKKKKDKFVCTRSCVIKCLMTIVSLATRGCLDVCVRLHSLRSGRVPAAVSVQLVPCEHTGQPHIFHGYFCQCKIMRTTLTNTRLVCICAWHSDMSVPYSQSILFLK